MPKWVIFNVSLPLNEYGHPFFCFKIEVLIMINSQWIKFERRSIVYWVENILFYLRGITLTTLTSLIDSSLLPVTIITFVLSTLIGSLFVTAQVRIEVTFKFIHKLIVSRVGSSSPTNNNGLLSRTPSLRRSTPSMLR